MRNVNTTAHLLRITYDVEVAGVEGNETGTYDLADGRYVEHLSAGPLSSSSGFDGEHSWTADATGFAQIDDHPNSVVDDLAAAHFQGRRGPEEPSITVRKRTHAATALTLRYAGLAGPIGVTISNADGHVAEIDDYTQVDATHSRYRDYRSIRGFEIPFVGIENSPERTSIEHVRTVDVLASVPASTFRKPQEPHDSTIVGATQTSVPLDALKQYESIVDVRINGAVVHMLFDSGSSNTMSTRTARRLGLTLIGEDRTGGIGTGLLRERYAMVKRMQIGAAVLRDQPFAVFDDKSSDTDGTIGCEVLERFVVRFDFFKHRLTLARTIRDLPERGTSLAMHLEGCQPEVRATLDGYTGAFGIDTGSGAALDVMAPFVRAHASLKRYHAKVQLDGAGIGGAVYAGSATARSMQFGSYTLTDIPIELSTMHAGAFDDPTQIGNIGVGLLFDFVMTLDYRSRRMWLST